MENEENIKKVLFKIIVIGDASVGKSCILNRFTKNEYRLDYNVTIGVEFSSKHITIDKTQVKLQIWDTAGQEAFRSIVGSFYRNSQAVILIYDITNLYSFQRVENWYNECKQYCTDDVAFVLVGNKLDLEEKRQVNQEMAEQFKKEKNFDLFFETSAKEGLNVEEMFTETAKKTLQKFENKNLLFENNVLKIINHNKNKNHEGCKMCVC